MEIRLCGTYLSNSWHVGLLESLKKKAHPLKMRSPVKVLVKIKILQSALRGFDIFKNKLILTMLLIVRMHPPSSTLNLRRLGLNFKNPGRFNL